MGVDRVMELVEELRGRAKRELEEFRDMYGERVLAGFEPGLLKILTCQSLSDSQAGFFMLIKVYFPTIYDIKHLMMFCNSLHGGLNKLAELLDVERVGICHQAGSDSLLTSCTIRKLKESFFNGNTEKYASVLYSLGVENGQNTH
ncbi:probable CCR4-associated factor 1 homolog 7 [Asparagus officinalis]|uniref:probable CCR4-associated factor 1 homolog 7 n=1 Tax=Asparagus officinalis TaxID=4686 RepID=UPI00098DE675|nr:probable CCR4-associated factor 1 homolog 7 [Asparagus officinalis]